MIRDKSIRIAAVLGLLAAGGAGLAGCISIDVDATDAKIEAAPEPSRLVGRWDVALRPETGEASTTTFVVTDVRAGTFTGTFYGSPIEDGRVTASPTALVFAGRTSDASGTYFHSGRLTRNGVIEGQTLSTERGFLMSWRARK